jgi:hypothetical protein
MPDIRRGTALLAVAVLVLAACGGNATRTPTATPASTPRAPSAVSQPSAAAGTPSAGQPGSFVAFCPAIRVRFMAPPGLMQAPSMCQGNSLFLIPNVIATTVEFLTIFRYANDARGQSAAGWADVLEGFHSTDTASGDVAWSADSQPTGQATAQGAAGYIGQFTRTDKGGKRYAGTLWTGAAGADTVAILLQGSSDQRAMLDADMAQVLRTIDLDAQ